MQEGSGELYTIHATEYCKTSLVFHVRGRRYSQPRTLRPLIAGSTASSLGMVQSVPGSVMESPGFIDCGSATRFEQAQQTSKYKTEHSKQLALPHHYKQSLKTLQEPIKIDYKHEKCDLFSRLALVRPCSSSSISKVPACRVQTR